MEWLLEYQLPFCDRDTPHWLGLTQKFDIAGKTKTVFSSKQMNRELQVKVNGCVLKVWNVGNKISPTTKGF